MSGPIHALVIWHGPRDHAAAAVAAVIAEDMHHADDTALLSTADIAWRARLGRTAAVRGVRILRDDGWTEYVPGGGRHRANRYRLRVAEAFSTCSETCRHATGLVEQALAIPVATRHESALNVSDSALNVSPRDHSTVTTVSDRHNARDAADETGREADGLPLVYGSVSDVTETERQTIDRVLSHVPAHARPNRNRRVLGLIVDASRAGHDAAAICRHLDPPRLDYTKVGPGAVVHALTELAAVPAQPAPATPAPALRAEPRERLADPEPIDASRFVAEIRATWAAKAGAEPPAAGGEKPATKNGTARPTNADRMRAAGARFEDPKSRRRRTS